MLRGRISDAGTGMSGSKTEFSRGYLWDSSPGTLRGAEGAARSPQLLSEAGAVLAKPPQPWRSPKETQHTLLGEGQARSSYPGFGKASASISQAMLLEEKPSAGGLARCAQVKPSRGWGMG